MNKLDFVPVQSSQIATIAYDAAAQTMRVEFFSHRHDVPGSIYEYDNVEPETHAAMIGAPSIYGYFSKTIKADPERYPYRKINT